MNIPNRTTAAETELINDHLIIPFTTTLFVKNKKNKYISKQTHRHYFVADNAKIRIVPTETETPSRTCA